MPGWPAGRCVTAQLPNGMLYARLPTVVQAQHRSDTPSHPATTPAMVQSCQRAAWEWQEPAAGGREAGGVDAQEGGGNLRRRQGCRHGRRCPRVTVHAARRKRPPRAAPRLLLHQQAKLGGSPGEGSSWASFQGTDLVREIAAKRLGGTRQASRQGEWNGRSTYGLIKPPQC